MNTARDAVSGSLVGYASKLRFPRLLMLTAGIFVLDLIVPDLLPFVDEVLLGLTTLILASLRTRVKEAISPVDAPATPAIESHSAEEE